MNKNLTLDQFTWVVIAAALPLLFLPALPTEVSCLILLFIALLLFIYRSAVCRLLVLFICCFLWNNYIATRAIQQIDYYSGQRLSIEGEMLSVDLGIASSSNNLLFRVEKVEGQSLLFYQQFNIALRWPQVGQTYQAGQKWQLNVEFRPVHSRLNQGSFDSQRWALANHQGLIALVKKAELLENQVSIRQRLISRTIAYLTHASLPGLLIALSFGERNLIPADQNKLFLQSGIAHLIAISGLHISFIALLGYLAARMLQIFLPARYIGIGLPYCFAWLIGVTYVWLAGANPPALRTMVALSSYLFLRWKGYSLSSWQVWRITVALLLIYDPLMILSDSAWLSCLAVACLIFWFQWLPLSNKYYRWYWFPLRWLHLQLAITLLLIPLQLVMFHGVSAGSLLCNFIAVPWVSFITLPIISFALLFLFWPTASENLWLMADQLLVILLKIINEIPHGWITPSMGVLGASFFGWFTIIAFRCHLWQLTPMLLISCLSLMCLPLIQRPDYSWRLDMLDVGHGLAVVIHNGYRAIIYDTASRWQQSSMAEKEIIPYLKWHGLQLDGIILSHQDLDHVGGLSALQRAYPGSWLMSPSSSLKSIPCLQGYTFYWQKLSFQVLWPKQLASQASNRHSCVIRVSDGQHSVLLTGDLEKQQELQLVNEYPNLLKADILQVPHHGSNTSSSGPFMRNVSPDIALFSVARFNPWHLPTEKVQQRYQQAKIICYYTAEEGQISIFFYKNKLTVYRYREDIAPRWYHNWYGSLLYTK